MSRVISHSHPALDALKSLTPEVHTILAKIKKAHIFKLKIKIIRFSIMAIIYPI